MLSSNRNLSYQRQHSSRYCVGSSWVLPAPRGFDRAVRLNAEIEQRRHVTVDGQGLELLLARAEKVSDPSVPILLWCGTLCWTKRVALLA